MSTRHLLFLFLTVSFTLFGQSNFWNLQKHKDGIKVYTRSVDGYDLDEFKGETIIKAPLEKITNALQNVEEMTQWMANCKTSRLIERNGAEQYHYSETEAPFPLSNRDAIVHYHFTKYKNGIRVIIDSQPNRLPQLKGNVRINYFKGFWLLIPIDETSTYVTYQLHSEAGGSIPGWVANMATVDTPFNTLKGLKSYINSQK